MKTLISRQNTQYLDTGSSFNVIYICSFKVTLITTSFCHKNIFVHEFLWWEVAKFLLWIQQHQLGSKWWWSGVQTFELETRYRLVHEWLDYPNCALWSNQWCKLHTQIMFATGFCKGDYIASIFQRSCGVTILFRKWCDIIKKQSYLPTCKLLLWFRTVLFRLTSLSTGYVPGFSFGCIYYFCNGLSTKWIRKNQGSYSTGQDIKYMILEWRWIKYHTYWIDSCDVSSSNFLNKCTWECCCIIECKHASWR